MCKVKFDVKDENDFSFLISNLILSKDKEFTCDEILTDLEKFDLPSILNKDYEVKKALIRLSECGLISKFTSLYSVCI